jgi:integrase
MKDGKNEMPQWVFAFGEGTPLDMHNVERRELEKCLKAAGLRKIRFHDLRHNADSVIMPTQSLLNLAGPRLGPSEHHQ